jgi:hypothetical protein
VEDFLEGKPPSGVGLYRRFEALALSVGDVGLAPARTRTGFQHGRIFAAVNAIREGRIDVHIVTAKPIRSPRIRRVESLGPADHVNHFSIESASQLDEEVVRWLMAGYRWGGGPGGRG